MICIPITITQLLVLCGVILIAIGLMIFWIDEARTNAKLRLLRAERGLYADPNSFEAIDERAKLFKAKDKGRR